MKTKVFISIIATLMMAASCMDMQVPGEDMIVEDDYSYIEGIVRDSTGVPLEYIMVTIEWGQGYEDNILYTSSEGKFKSAIPEEKVGQETSIILTLTDIDGEDNGGEFETLTDKVMIFQEETEEDSSVIFLEYRLSRATPSESSPQS